MRLTALQSGEIDLLARNTTFTLTRDTAGLNFTAVNFYDGQGFLVPKRLGVTRARDLAGATVCVQTGTTNELNVADYFRAHAMALKTVTFEKYAEAVAAYVAGRCDAFSTDVSGLAVIRANNVPDPAEHVILPETISKEPLAPAVRHGDARWFSIVQWTQFAMVAAEELALTQDTVDAARASADPLLQRLLGVTPGLGSGLGLPDTWAYAVVRQVGSYGESFERNVGTGSKLQLSRGLNALASHGGLMYAPPFR
jgi:general L-amino acid transport system substrate-binding protein